MRTKDLRYFLLAGTALVATAGAAQAQTTTPTPVSGTAAGTVITNQAQATYTVNGTPQSTSSNVTSFVVDKKVAFTLVRSQTGNTQVNIGQTGAVTTFKLTNTTNGTQDFLLDAGQQNISVGVLPGTDDFDVANMKVYVDKNNNGVYDPGVDTAQFVDELAPDTSVSIFIVADIPSGQNQNLAFVDLHATVAAGGTAGTAGAALQATDQSVVNSDSVVDIVFADDDSDGVFAGDIARNGQGIAYAAYEIATRNVALSVTKSSRVLSDGVNALLPKALPGAMVEYCLVVNNATLLTPANAVTVTDVVPANMTYDPGSITIGAIGGATQCLVNGVSETDALNDELPTDPYKASYDATANKITAVIPTVGGGTGVAVSFRAKIK
jgi:uncharacterized repeat protein (TIGR01451 family)